MTKINVSELRSRLENGNELHLFDVREEWEYEENNIGGRLIPLTSIPAKLMELASLKDDEIVVFCQTGIRSHQARLYLESKGFSKVRSLSGGLQAYMEEG